jgi:hypothetical protein
MICHWSWKHWKRHVKTEKWLEPWFIQSDQGYQYTSRQFSKKTRATRNGWKPLA